VIILHYTKRIVHVETQLTFLWGIRMTGIVKMTRFVPFVIVLTKLVSIIV
jgi:hypothetical protein